MPRSILVFVLLLGLLAGAAGFSYLLLRGGPAGEPDAAIPAGADATLIIPSLPILLKHLSGTRMGPAPGETEWELLSEVIAALLESAGVSYEPDPQWLARNLAGSAALSWVPSGRAGAPPHLVLAFEVKSVPARFLDAVARAALPEMGLEPSAFKRRSHRGFEYGTFRLPGAAEIVCVASHRRLVLVTVSGEAMRQCLTALTKSETSLPRDPSFRRVRRDLRERSDVIAYLSGRFLKSTFLAPDGARSAWRTLLIPGAPEGAGISVTVGKRGLFRERIRILESGMTRNLPGKLFSARPREVTTSAALPAGYPFYVGLSFSEPGAFFEMLPDVLAKASGQEPARMRERIAGLEEFLGLDFRKDLLDVIGDEASIALDPGSDPAFVIALKPSDPAGVKRLLVRADGLARAAEAYRSSEHSGEAIVTYEYPRLLPRRPSYAFSGSTLLISDSPAPIEAALVAAARKSPAPQGEALSPAWIGSTRAHVAALADTSRLILWLRGGSGGTERDGIEGARESGWIRRLEDLLPRSAGPLPPTSASFILTGDGMMGEWSAPISPVMMAALMMALPPREPLPVTAGVPEAQPVEPDRSREGPPEPDEPDDDDEGSGPPPPQSAPPVSRNPAGPR